jgi:hypothetical protein
MDIMWGKKWGKEMFVARFYFYFFEKRSSSILFYFWGQCSSFHLKQNVKF